MTKKLSEQTDLSKQREKEMQMTIDDSKRSDTKAREKLNHVERVLENTSEELGEMKLRLSGEEGRNAGLESQVRLIIGRIHFT